MKPVPLQPNLPTPTTCFGNPVPPAQYYECPHCHKQSPLVREWAGLTEEEIFSVLVNLQEIYNRPPTTDGRVVLARAIEAKLKEKNNA